MRMTLPVLVFAGAMAMFAAPGSAVTFNKDVLPILQKHCQNCHRPGEVAPMSLITYRDVRPWAKAMRDAVLKKTMPPWFADPAYGHFRNERRLTTEEINVLVAWADGGAVEGDPKDRPAPLRFASGWSIGEPDIVIGMPKDIAVAAQGQMDQANVLVRVKFPKDLWVKAAEVRPGNPKVVHHMKAWVRFPESEWMKDAPEGELYKPQRSAAWLPGTPRARPMFGEGLSQDMLAKFNPGVNAQEFTAGDAAKFIPAGSDIVFECHYVPNGTAQTDRSRVGIVLADAPPKKRYVTVTGINNNQFLIPARASNHEVRAASTLEMAAELVWVQPHMHMRAKDYELRAVYPTGESQILLKVPRYSFAWQLGYEMAKPVMLPKGTKLESIAHYDNSGNNPYNPNPAIDVGYGPQSTDEMAVSFMGFVMDVTADPVQLIRRQGRAPAAAAMQ
jgi:hypothetical protein